LVPLCPHDERMNGYVMLCASAFIDSRRQWDRFGELVEGVLDNAEVPMVDALCMAQTARSSVIKAANPSARNALEFGVTTARALRSCLGDSIPAYQLLVGTVRYATVEDDVLERHARAYLASRAELMDEPA